MANSTTKPTTPMVTSFAIGGFALSTNRDKVIIYLKDLSGDIDLIQTANADDERFSSASYEHLNYSVSRALFPNLFPHYMQWLDKLVAMEKADPSQDLVIKFTEEEFISSPYMIKRLAGVAKKVHLAFRINEQTRCRVRDFSEWHLHAKRAGENGDYLCVADRVISIDEESGEQFEDLQYRPIFRVKSLMSYKQFLQNFGGEHGLGILDEDGHHRQIHRVPDISSMSISEEDTLAIQKQLSSMEKSKASAQAEKVEEDDPTPDPDEEVAEPAKDSKAESKAEVKA